MTQSVVLEGRASGLAASGGSALIKWTIVGTVLQVVMVVAGHYVDFIRQNVFAIGGMGISLVVGVLYVRAAARSAGGAALGGGFVGGGCALLGIFVSVLLGDVPANILVFGTLGSLLAGLIGGVVAYAVAGRKSY